MLQTFESVSSLLTTSHLDPEMALELQARRLMYTLDWTHWIVPPPLTNPIPEVKASDLMLLDVTTFLIRASGSAGVLSSGATT